MKVSKGEVVSVRTSPESKEKTAPLDLHVKGIQRKDYNQ